MATTSGDLVAGTAAGTAASRGGKGGGGWPRRTGRLAVGVAVLGCAAVLAFGGSRVGTPSQPGPAANPVVQPATSSLVLGAPGRTGPSDEYLQADFANALPISRRTGPADEYGQAESVPMRRAIARTGPAEEYTRAEGLVPAAATHGAGPADEYDR